MQRIHGCAMQQADHRLSIAIAPYASQAGWMRANLPCAAAVEILASLAPQMRALTSIKATHLLLGDLLQAWTMVAAD